MVWVHGLLGVSIAGHVALSLVHQCALGVDQTKQRSIPKCVIDVCRMVYQAKCSLIKVWKSFHQALYQLS